MSSANLRCGHPEGLPGTSEASSLSSSPSSQRRHSLRGPMQPAAPEVMECDGLSNEGGWEGGSLQWMASVHHCRLKRYCQAMHGDCSRTLSTKKRSSFFLPESSRPCLSSVLRFATAASTCDVIKHHIDKVTLLLKEVRGTTWIAGPRKNEVRLHD